MFTNVLLFLCTVLNLSYACAEVATEQLTIAPAKTKRISRASLRNELIEVCESFAHTLIAEVEQVSLRFEQAVSKRKGSQALQECLRTRASEREKELHEVLVFFGEMTIGDKREKTYTGACQNSECTALVRAQSRWVRAIARVQERLLTEVKFLLEQDAQGHFYGATKDELRKAKGSIESFMKESEALKDI